MHPPTALNRILFVIGCFLISLLIAGCGNSGAISVTPVSVPSQPQVALAPTIMPMAARAAQAAVTPGVAKGGSNSNGNDITSVSQRRIVLKNATLTMTVENPTSSVRAITQLAEQMGGWVVVSNSSQTERDGHRLVQATISVRVPAEQLDSVLEQIKTGAVSVDSENIIGDDVTQKYVDLSSQLSNLEATEAQLQKIMSTATNVNDVLAVQQRLTDVQGQIEGIKGQLKYFSEANAYSLINLTLIQKLLPATPMPTATITPTPTPKGLGLTDWQPAEVAQNAADTVVSAGEIAISLLIWLLIAGIPIAIPVVIVIYVYRRFFRGKSVSKIQEAVPSTTDNPA